MFRVGTKSKKLVQNGPKNKKSSMIMAPTSWSRKAMIPKALLVKSGVSVIPHHISGLITVNVLSIQKGRGTLQL